jgi:hypothetical protein
MLNQVILEVVDVGHAARRNRIAVVGVVIEQADGNRRQRGIICLRYLRSSCPTFKTAGKWGCIASIDDQSGKGCRMSQRLRVWV